MRTPRTWVSIVGLAVSAVAGSAWGDAMSGSPTAQSGVQRKRVEWTVTADAYVAVNPRWWNAATSASVGFGEPVGEDRRWSLTLDVAVNDAYATPAGSLEWRAAPPLTLILEYRGFAFYGINGALLSFGKPNAPYGDDAIDALIGTSAETSGYGQRVALAEKLHTTVGPVILAAQSAVAFYNLASRPGVYLDWETDKLVREVDGVFLLRTGALMKPFRSEAFELAAGPYWEATAAGRTRLVRQRVGGLVVVRALDTVHFGIAAGVDAVDPNRQGQGFAVANVGLDLP